MFLKARSVPCGKTPSGTPTRFAAPNHPRFAAASEPQDFRPGGGLRTQHYPNAMKISHGPAFAI
jgi:hypothetical protein